MFAAEGEVNRSTDWSFGFRSSPLEEMGILALMTGWAGPSGFGSATTAEQVTQGINASGLTAIVTGEFILGALKQFSTCSLVDGQVAV